MQSLKISTPFIVRLAAVLLSLIALGYIAILAKKILAPLFFSLLFALVLLPVANRLERQLRIPRPGASVLSVLLLISFLVFSFYLIGSQISSLIHDWPSFKGQFHASLNSLQNWIALHFHIDIQQQKNYINNTTSKVLSSSPSVATSTLEVVLLM